MKVGRIAALADDLAKPPADYRLKDVFGFRAYTGTKLEVTRDGARTVFEKKKGTEKDAVEKWTLTQPANQTSAQNSAVSLTLAGSDPEGAALTFGAAGLPPGLTVNAASGVISGTVTTAGAL